MIDSYDSFVALGVIVPAKPTVSTPSISTGQVYNNDGNLVSASALSLFTNSSGA